MTKMSGGWNGLMGSVRPDRGMQPNGNAMGFWRKYRPRQVGPGLPGKWQGAPMGYPSTTYAPGYGPGGHVPPVPMPPIFKPGGGGTMYPGGNTSGQIPQFPGPSGGIYAGGGYDGGGINPGGMYGGYFPGDYQGGPGQSPPIYNPNPGRTPPIYNPGGHSGNVIGGGLPGKYIPNGGVPPPYYHSGNVIGGGQKYPTPTNMPPLPGKYPRPPMRTPPIYAGGQQPMYPALGPMGG